MKTKQFIASFCFFLLSIFGFNIHAETTDFAASREYSRCKLVDNDKYFDYKTSDQTETVRVDKSDCKNSNGKIKIFVEQRNVLFRGGMNAAVQYFGLYNPTDNKFVPFTESKDDEAKKIYDKMQSHPEVVAARARITKENPDNIGLKWIGKTFIARTQVGEYSCSQPPTEVSGKIWVSPKGVVDEKDKKPYTGTYIVNWKVPDLSATEPKPEVSINHSIELCNGGQYMLPRSATEKMENGLISPVEIRSCYKPPPNAEAIGLVKNMNDVTSHLDSQPADQKDFTKLLNKYLNDNGVTIDPNYGK